MPFKVLDIIILKVAERVVIHLELVDVQLHRRRSLCAFLVERAPSGWRLSLLYGEQEFTHGLLLESHRRGVDFGPELELQFVEDLRLLTFSARSRHVELVICDFDSLVVKRSAPRHIKAIGMLDLYIDSIQVLVPREWWRDFDGCRFFFLNMIKHLLVALVYLQRCVSCHSKSCIDILLT